MSPEADDDDGWDQTVPVQGYITVSSPNTDVDLTCLAFPGNGNNISAGGGGLIVATQVSSVSVSN